MTPEHSTCVKRLYLLDGCFCRSFVWNKRYYGLQREIVVFCYQIDKVERPIETLQNEVRLEHRVNN